MVDCSEDSSRLVHLFARITSSRMVLAFSSGSATFSQILPSSHQCSLVTTIHFSHMGSSLGSIEAVPRTNQIREVSASSALEIVRDNQAVCRPAKSLDIVGIRVSIGGDHTEYRMFLKLPIFLLSKYMMHIRKLSAESQVLCDKLRLSNPRP